MSEQTFKFAYFGGEPIGVPVLEELKATGLLPSLIVCNPDRPAGRKQVLTPPPVKLWAEAHGIEVFQPEHIPKHKQLDKGGVGPLHRLTGETWDVFVVVAYNHILPAWFLELPKHGAVNVHPSLLPKLRGASPIRSTILEDMRTECGVSVMLLDKEMDHGPIIAQESLIISEEAWPMPGPELDQALGHLGGAVLADVLPRYVRGEIKTIEQDHSAATYCGRITKDMAELIIDPHNLPSDQEAYQAFLKIQAYAGWPVTFFKHEGKRYKITSAHLGESGSLIIEKVIPEGKAETDFGRLF